MLFLPKRNLARICTLSEHLEDSIINDGIPGAKSAMTIMKGLVNMLSSHSESGVNVTVKWDGAPAIFCGTHPETKKFFVGTKSIFNKVTPKINYTNADIDQNHSGALVNILKVALKEFKNLGIKGIIQGDLLYTYEDIKMVNIGGKRHIAFKPNTITYTVPKDSDLAKKIIASKIGVVFHTQYNGKNMEKLSASFGFDANSLKNIKNVWATDATFRDLSGEATLSSKQTQKIKKLVQEIEQSLNTLDPSFFNWLESTKEMKPLIKTYINSRVRSGNFDLASSTLKNFIKDKYEQKISSLKTEKAINNKKQELKFLLDDIKKYDAQFKLIFFIQKRMVDAKLMLVRQLEKVKTLGTFIETSDGFKVTSPEGFVAIDNVGNAIKLVDRMEFSRQNFLQNG